MRPIEASSAVARIMAGSRCIRGLFLKRRIAEREQPRARGKTKDDLKKKKDDAKILPVLSRAEIRSREKFIFERHDLSEHLN